MPPTLVNVYAFGGDYEESDSITLIVTNQDLIEQITQHRMYLNRDADSISDLFKGLLEGLEPVSSVEDVMEYCNRTPTYNEEIDDDDDKEEERVDMLLTWLSGIDSVSPLRGYVSECPMPCINAFFYAE